MIIEAVILAGGFGSRLRGVVDDVPKPLATVAGRPFLFRLLDMLADVGCRRVVLAIGYLGEKIVAAVGSEWRGMAIAYSVETEPLGTGGALRQAISLSEAEDMVVLNGDSYVAVDIPALLTFHRSSGRALSMTLIEVPDVSRYGGVETTGETAIAFHEKGGTGAGLINAGVYAVDRDLFGRDVPTRFSFEADFLQPGVQYLRPAAFVANGLFIDIGVPDDYARAQTLFA